MTRTELSEASQILSQVADAVGGDAGKRLEEQARQLDELDERDRGPDHGRLDRHQQALRDVKADVDDESAARIDDAIELIAKYRETVPGV